MIHFPESLGESDRKSIGIEERVGKRWPNKFWQGYGALKKELIRNNFEVISFKQRDEFRKYLEDIQRCRLIISGDTLAMHIALGYKIPCIGIFNCTSPSEIYDYGVLQKIISPLLNDFFYNTQYLKTATEAVSIDEVLQAVSFQLSHGEMSD